MATTFGLLFLLALVSIFNITFASNSDEDNAKPNILLIMMDDLGFSDASINGGVFNTPNLNKLWRNSGIKLNYHYSNTLCSTSRSSLLTGRYSWRNGVNKLVRPFTMQHIDDDVPFISQKLKDIGYKTGMFGKYHLGYSSKEYLPFNKGFDRTLFFQSGAIGYTSHQDCTPWYWALKGIHIKYTHSHTLNIYS